MKKLQLDNNAPTKIVLLGPTGADPRAQVAVEAVAASLARFQLAARQQVALSGAGQHVQHTTLPGGIRAQYQHNNGIEVLYLTVPLPGTNEVYEPPKEEPKKKAGLLAIDVLFTALPTVYDTSAITTTYGSDLDAYSISEYLLKWRHSIVNAAGAVITSEGKTLDVVSCSTWGLTGNTKKLSSADLGAFGVVDEVDMAATSLGWATPAITETPSPPLQGVYPGLPPADVLEQSYFGATFLVQAEYPAQEITIDIWAAWLNNTKAYTFDNFAGIDTTTYYKNVPTPVNIQCREFSPDDALVMVNVPVQDPTWQATGYYDTRSAPSTHVDVVISEGPVLDTSWRFVALKGWTDDGLLPADRNGEHMGDVLYASQDVLTATVTNQWLAGALYDTVPHVSEDVSGWLTPHIDVASRSGQVFSQPEWPYAATVMTPIATVTWRSRASSRGKGSADVVFNADASGGGDAGMAITTAGWAFFA